MIVEDRAGWRYEFKDTSNTVCPSCGGYKDSRSVICKECRAPYAAEWAKNLPRMEARKDVDRRVVCPTCGGRKEYRANVCASCFRKTRNKVKAQRIAREVYDDSTKTRIPG